MSKSVRLGNGICDVRQPVTQNLPSKRSGPFVTQPKGCGLDA